MWTHVWSCLYDFRYRGTNEVWLREIDLLENTQVIFFRCTNRLHVCKSPLIILYSNGNLIPCLFTLCLRLLSRSFDRVLMCCCRPSISLSSSSFSCSVKRGSILSLRQEIFVWFDEWNHSVGLEPQNRIIAEKFCTFQIGSKYEISCSILKVRFRTHFLPRDHTLFGFESL